MRCSHKVCGLARLHSDKVIVVPRYGASTASIPQTRLEAELRSPSLLGMSQIEFALLPPNNVIVAPGHATD